MLNATFLDKTPEFLIAFVTAILGVGYPIILQAISRLDDQYGSLRVTTIFKIEFEMRVFKWVMALTLVSVGLYIINIPPPVDYLENSAFYFLVVFTVLLVGSYISLINKYINYLSSEYLTKLFIRRHLREPKREMFFNSLVDLLLISLNKGKDDVAVTIYSFLYSEFKKVRDKPDHSPVTYPYIFYYSLNRIITTLVKQNSPIPSELENGTIGGKLIFGSYDRHKISSDTYKWLWNYLIVATIHAQDRMVFKYWTTAYQYHQTCFRLSYDMATETDGVDEEKFLEFHYALGGYLLFSERYSCLNKLFNYTTSSPGTSEMLPKNMSDVFVWLNHFGDRGDLRSMAPLSFFFPEVEGISSGDTVKHWICKYIGVLFLRQYNLQTLREGAFKPNLPDSIYDLTIWLNQVPYWKNIILSNFENQRYIQNFGFSHLTEDWFEKRKLPHPSEFVDNLKASIVKKIDETEKNQSVSMTQKEIFADNIRTSLLPVIEQMSSLSGNTYVTKISDINRRYIEGLSYIQDKFFYTDEGSDSILGRDAAPIKETISKLTSGISEVLFHMTTEVFFFQGEHIEDMIRRLNLNEDHYIVSFGMDQYISNLSPFYNHFATGTLFGIDVLSCRPYLIEKVDSCFFILRKDSFPKIEFLEPFIDTIENFELEKVSSEHQVYFSIIDINQNSFARKNLSKNFPGEDFSKFVNVLINLTAEFSWDKSVKCLMIQFQSNRAANGILSKLEALHSF